MKWRVLSIESIFLLDEILLSIGSVQILLKVCSGPRWTDFGKNCARAPTRNFFS